jgi:hypothetical protein
MLLSQSGQLGRVVFLGVRTSTVSLRRAKQATSAGFVFAAFMFAQLPLLEDPSFTTFNASPSSCVVLKCIESS